MNTNHNCRMCKHLRLVVEVSPPKQTWSCVALIGMNNLHNFPFRRTSCVKWEPKITAFVEQTP